MQYFLTKEEYSDLTPKTELHRRDDALEASSRLILELSGFKCRHRRGGSFPSGYCDECPLYTKFPRTIDIKVLCTLPKEWSK